MVQERLVAGVYKVLPEPLLPLDTQPNQLAAYHRPENGYTNAKVVTRSNSNTNCCCHGEPDTDTVAVALTIALTLTGSTYRIRRSASPGCDPVPASL